MSTPFPGNTSAFQQSSIAGGHAEGTGGISLAFVSPEPGFASSYAGSFLLADFTLDAPAILSITAEVSFTQNAAAMALRFVSNGVLVEIFDSTSTIIFSDGISVEEGLDHGSRTVHVEKLLTPGMYHLQIAASGSQDTISADARSTLSWSGSADLIAVPEPGGLAGAALLLALTRRFGGAGRRSRPV